MHVFLTGGTGFVGTYVLRALVDSGHTARCLIRDAAPELVAMEEVETVKGDITDPRSLTGLLRGCDAVINLVGIIEEHPSRGVTFEAIHYEGTKHVVAEALDSDIDVFIHMSANGARPDGVSGYQTSKWKAEEVVKRADFRHWTIFRPSIVFGDPGPEGVEFATRLAETLIGPFPVLPVFGDGQYALQPVPVEAVAAAFAQALTNEASRGQTYCVAGEQQVSYIEALDRITHGMGLEPKPKVKQPVWLVRPIVHTVGKIGLLPISPDQFEMLLEGNTCDPSAFYRDFDVPRRPFTADNLEYLSMRTG